MNFTSDFRDIDKNDVQSAGGKGASLGEILKTEISVPPGFVILSNAFEFFLKENALEMEINSALRFLDYRDTATTEKTSIKIRELIADKEIPPIIIEQILNSFNMLGAQYVAVRSSATAEDSSIVAWAGQLETYLNTTEANLLENVKKCWSSLFTPRAIFYRFENDLQDQAISVAVIVQKMIQSEVSGVAFSVHPVTQDRDILIIEATPGLGEVLVSGQVTPDSYIVAKSSRSIVSQNYQTHVGVLSNKQILELSQIIIGVENHYGFPCDIEWALESGKFYILQSRPITTLDKERPRSKNKHGFWEKILKIVLSPQKIIFEKITRDTTYIMQDLWAYGCSEAVEKEYGWKNPYLPIIINHMNQGSIEVWENVKATRWLANTILKENNKSPEFMDEILKKYKEKLSAIHKLLEEKILETKNLKKLIELSKEAMAYYIPYYYSALDNRTPKNIKGKVLEMRNRDDFFTKNNIVIRDSIINLYPKLRGYETTIFSDELDSIPDIEILKERRGCFFVIQGEGRFVATLDEFSKTHPNFVFKRELVKQGGVDRIKGEIAQRGKVVGRVKILRRRDQISEVAEGDIIISPMTTTDFLPAILKAGAIVTDEGGITCHAAITARELKKPCITGTKIATQVLKDGDLVEVDANNGFVKILG